MTETTVPKKGAQAPISAPPHGGAHGLAPGWLARIAEAQLQTHETIGGREVERVRFGSVPSDRHDYCGDCGVARGQLHVVGCDEEPCPLCHGQAATCTCPAAGEAPIQ